MATNEAIGSPDHKPQSSSLSISQADPAHRIVATGFLGRFKPVASLEPILVHTYVFHRDSRRYRLTNSPQRVGSTSDSLELP